MLKDLSHPKRSKQVTNNEIKLTPKESKVPTTKTNSSHFSWWHTKYQHKKDKASKQKMDQNKKRKTMS